MLRIKVNKIKPVAQQTVILLKSASIPFLFPPNRLSAPPEILPSPAVLPDCSNTVATRPRLVMTCSTWKTVFIANRASLVSRMVTRRVEFIGCATDVLYHKAIAVTMLFMTHPGKRFALVWEAFVCLLKNIRKNTIIVMQSF